MISNERQYRITKAAAEKFKQAVKDLDKNGGLQEGIHPRLVQAQREAAQSQLDDLLEEIDETSASKPATSPSLKRVTRRPAGWPNQGAYCVRP